MANISNNEELFETCPNIYDLKRLALMMSMNKSLFIFVTQELDDDSVILGDVCGVSVGTIIEENASEQVFGMFPRQQSIGDTVHEITNLLHKSGMWCRLL